MPQRGHSVLQWLTVNHRPSFASTMTHGTTSNDHGEGRGGNGGEVGAEQGRPAIRHRSPECFHLL